MKTKPLFITILYLVVFAGLQTSYAQNDTSACKKHTNIEVKEIDAQKALVIKADVPISAIGETMGELYGKLYTYAGEKGVQFAGPPFAIYYSYDPEGNVVFKAGVPIATEVEGEGDIHYKEFPIMKVVTTVYTGAYEEMEPVYGHIQKYMEENKLESNGTSWEVYLTDPNQVADPSENKTIIYFPLK